jgi:enterochelin esterase-like enzyme/sugar lactone lactonase YvrE
MLQRTVLVLALAAALFSGYSVGAQSPAPEITPGPYALGADSMRQPGVPQGTVTKHTWASTIFPGTVRDYWVYVPAQYQAGTPAAVMVFQDGGNYVREDGGWRVPVVFDNLIHRKEMPVTIGVFVNPGVVPAATDQAQPRFNRSFEYDAVSDRYVRFLLDEILPEVGKTYSLAQDGNSRAIAGASSGAIAAFTAAWQRPDAFSRVLSTIGTYVGLRGGNEYPTLVRKSEPKPLRVFLQDGSSDLNIYAGDWWLANQQMLSALTFAGYDVTHVWGDGGHDGKQGGAILPDALRWLWRGYPKPIGPGSASKQPLMTAVLLPDETWRLVAPLEARRAGAVAANAGGDVFFVDGDRLMRAANGSTTVVSRDGGSGVSALRVGADGRVYASRPAEERIVKIDASGRESIAADGVAADDFVVSHAGHIYAIDASNRRLTTVIAGGTPAADAVPVDRPGGVMLTPDQTILLVSDRAGRFVYSYQVQPDGRLAHGQPYFHLHVREEAAGSEAGAMATDANGYLYVVTDLGVQVCDQPGRVNGIIALPWRSPASAGAPGAITFGGAALSELYLSTPAGIYARKTRVTGVLPSQPPVKPPTPRL